MMALASSLAQVNEKRRRTMSETKWHHKPIYLLVALALLLSLGLVAVPLAGTVFADVINVDSSDTTAEINAAIASANSGDIVQFADGTYNLTAPLFVNVTGVILQGDTRTPGNVVINAGTIAAADADAFQVKANNVTIKGFKITNAVSAANHSAGGWQNAGIMVGGEYTLVSWLSWPNVVNIVGGTFQHNIIDGCSMGIYLYESQNTTISHNTIQNSTITNHTTAGVGISCWNEGHQNPTNNTINDNIIQDNARIGILFGIWDARTSAAGTIIQNNTITGNGDASAAGDEAGISLMWMDGDITITGNTVSGNTYGILAGCDGYSSSYCTDVVVHFNNIVNNDKTGTKRGIENRFNPGGDTDGIDAVHNWWGAADGPSLSPGSGDKVSANVDYTPWLGAPLDLPAVHHEALGAGSHEVDASDEADTRVTLTTTGDTDITIARYESQPFPDEEFPNEALGNYIDIHVSNPENVTWPIYVEMSYTDAEVATAGIQERSLGLYYYQSVDTFHRCSDTGVNTMMNLIWANVTEAEAGYLVWTAFGTGGFPPPVPRVPSTTRWGIVAMITLFAGLLTWTVRGRRLAS
jgi:parallel beta-helix repeat protein